MPVAADGSWNPDYYFTGTPRPFEVTDDDDRGPDSVECADATFGLHRFRHSDCFGDYTYPENRMMARHFGFWCGCRCHDREPEEAA